MKKISILIIAILFSGCVFAQKTVLNIYNDVVNKQVIVNYKNEIGEEKAASFSTANFTGSDSTRNSNFIKIVKDRIDTIQTVDAQVTRVVFSTNNNPGNGVFVIIGDNLPAKVSRVSKLKGADSTLALSFFAFVLSYTGNPLTDVDALFGTGTIRINGVLYDYLTINSASAGILGNVKELMEEQFNE